MLCLDPAFGKEDLPNAYQGAHTSRAPYATASTGLHAQLWLSCLSSSLSFHAQQDHNGKPPRARKAKFSLAWCDDTSVRLKTLKEVDVSNGRCRMLPLRHLVHQSMPYNGRLTLYCKVTILMPSASAGYALTHICMLLLACTSISGPQEKGAQE